MFCKEQCHRGERGPVGGDKSGKQDYSCSGEMAAGVRVRVGAEGGTNGQTWVFSRGCGGRALGQRGMRGCPWAVLCSSSSSPGPWAGPRVWHFLFFLG